MNFTNARCVIVIAAMPGCGACDEYLPRFEKQLRGWQAHGVPFVEVVGVESPLLKGQIPILVLDATSEDPGIQGLCNQYEISGMPTTLVLPKVGRSIKVEGAVDDPQIYELLHAAVLANR